MRHFVTAAVLATVLSAAHAHAQTRNERGWLDVNFGVASSASSSEVQTSTGTIYRETATFTARIPSPSSGASFDFGGGVMFLPWLGAGVSVSGTSHEDEVALSATIPHPTFFNAAATGTRTTEALQRTEGTIHVQAMFAPVRGDKFRLRVFAGPSFFRYKADRVEGLRWEHVFLIFQPVQEVTVTSHTIESVEETAWGFHGGADASYFFSRVVGIGGFARFSRGSATLDPEPFSGGRAKVTLGGLQAGGGLRLRF